MNDKYHASLRILHWVMFILFAIIFVLGVTMVEFEECKGCEPWAMYNFHKSTGVLVFLLVLLRLVFRWTTRVPPHPPEIPTLNHRIAQGVVHIIYLLMILVPISGYALSNVHGYDVNLYGIALPKLFPTNPEWEVMVDAAHTYLAYTFLGFIALHILGVIAHHIRGLEILRRIT
jgi:cytochrome b561